MSFILDALKQAERERHRGKPPGFDALHHDTPEPRRRKWPWFVLGVALLVNAVVLGALFWPAQTPSPGPATVSVETEPAPARPAKHPAPPPRAPRKPASLAPAPPATGSEHRPQKGLTAQPAQRTTPAIGTKQRGSVPGATTRVHGPTGDLASAAARGTKPTLPEPAQPAEVVDGADVPEPPVGEEPPPALQLPADRVPLARAGVTAARPVAATGVPNPLPAPAAGEKTTPGGSDNDAPLLEDLPPGVRAGLERLKIEGHVYTPDPARRFVFIDMRSYRVGERIGDNGPLLEEITPDGVIVDYGDGRARLPMTR